MTLRLKPMLLAGALGISACTSQPTHYYTLVAPLPLQQSPPSATPLQLEMLPVILPVQVDQPALVVRQSNGSLVILEGERWGAPLADEFHDALTAQLEQRLGTRDLAGLPKNSEQPVLSVRTDVRRFESIPGQYALIDVVWSLSLRNSGPKRQNLTCSSLVRETAGSSMENLVVAHQHAVGKLATLISTTAKQWTQQGVAKCP
ncbi:membrane integrity-associated transporter subunit PqiC [Pseudomonas sp. Pseusp122]|uniref:PqiC family protein n=1 Tax=unclassified Pseudomonas TaxID=196821 RepID=UPI0039A5125D